MATATVLKVAATPTTEDRMDLAKKANEEICALIAACRRLPQLAGVDDLQRQLVVRGMMARMNQLADITWEVMAEVPEDFDEKKALVEFLGPV